VRGNGRSRRGAEQSAAKLALESAQAAAQALRRAKRKVSVAADDEPVAERGRGAAPAAAELPAGKVAPAVEAGAAEPATPG
jgi:hypothetical protein